MRKRGQFARFRAHASENSAGPLSPPQCRRERAAAVGAFSVRLLCGRFAQCKPPQLALWLKKSMHAVPACMDSVNAVLRKACDPSATSYAYRLRFRFHFALYRPLSTLYTPLYVPRKRGTRCAFSVGGRLRFSFTTAVLRSWLQGLKPYARSARTSGGGRYVWRAPLVVVRVAVDPPTRVAERGSVRCALRGVGALRAKAKRLAGCVV